MNDRPDLHLVNDTVSTRTHLATPDPSASTDPTPRQSETARHGKLRAAANLAPSVIGGEIGEQVRQLMWVFYNTPEASYLEPLAKGIIAEARSEGIPL